MSEVLFARTDDVDASAALAALAGAEAARDDAQAAQVAAEAAQAAAELAETNAETAETNAETAATAAQLAETNAETAETAAEAAQAAAEAAQAAAEAIAATIGSLDSLTDVDAATPNDGDVLTFDSGSGDWVAAAPSPAPTAFTDLTDAPSDYTGHALKVVRVTAGEDGVEFGAVLGTMATQTESDYYTTAEVDALLATYQPLDADLTAIAALTTTAFGLSLLELADETALEALLDTLPNLTSIQSQTVSLSAPLTIPADPGADRFLFWDESANATAWLTPGNGLTITTTTIAVDSASQTVDGIVELATATEYRTGTDTGRVPAIDQIWASADHVALTDAATIALDFGAGYNFTLSNMAGNRTLGNPTNTKDGQSGVIVIDTDGSARTLNKSANLKSVGITWPIAIGANQLAYISYHVFGSSDIWIAGVAVNPA